MATKLEQEDYLSRRAIDIIAASPISPTSASPSVGGG